MRILREMREKGLGHKPSTFLSWHAFVRQQSRIHSPGLDDPVSYIKAGLLG